MVNMTMNICVEVNEVMMISDDEEEEEALWCCEKCNETTRTTSRMGRTKSGMKNWRKKELHGWMGGWVLPPTTRIEAAQITETRGGLSIAGA